MKGIIFGGCSFTWGQGLYFYSDLPNLVYPQGEGPFNRHDLKPSHIRFKNTLYYPRLVANHFNTFEVVKNGNGGGEDETFYFFKYVFGKNNGTEDNFTHDRYDYGDIDYMIIQLSQLWRNRFYYDENNPERGMNLDLHQFDVIKKRFPDFIEWFNNSDKSIEDCNKLMVEQQFNRLKKEVMFYEEKGIKVRILSWPNDLIQHILNDPFLSERFIKLKYNDIEYNSIEDLQRSHKNMIIRYDFENFVGNPPFDHHPSKLCHQVIAKNIINKIIPLF
jgi:hypothetical protein